MEDKRYIDVNKDDEGKRIDAFLSNMLPELSRSFIKKLISDGRILANGRTVKASYTVKDGDRIEAVIPPPENLSVEAEDLPLDIIYEDDDILIVNKERGMSVHPGAGHSSHTLVNALLAHCGDSLSGINGVIRPGIVHRIDKDTSGILCVCKNDSAHRSIASQLAAHSITRVYLGLVTGRPSKDKDTISTMIGRDPVNRKKMSIHPKSAARNAVTHYRILEEFKGYTLCSFELETGRTHQIRVHMSSIGHPLAGDPLYGPKKDPLKANGQLLHAAKLGFIHPSSGEYVEFEAPLPEDFSDIIRKLKQQLPDTAHNPVQ